MGEMDTIESQTLLIGSHPMVVVAMHPDSDRIILDRVLPVFLGNHPKLPFDALEGTLAM